jgi:hypothetical protein
VAVSNSRNSRTRSSFERARDDLDPGSSLTDENATELPHSPPPTGRSNVAITAFGVWAAALIGLAVLTSNPVTLNHNQVLAAPFIVEGTIDADNPKLPGGMMCHVKRSWPSGDARIGIDILIEGAEQLPLTAGESYLVPVEPIAGGRYRIVTSPKPFSAPFIYTANPKTIVQLEAILQDQR